MPPKPEYWTISEKQFKASKTRIDNLGQRLFESLNKYGFTKIESQADWLGLTINKRKEESLTFVSLSLYRETPLEFELVLRQWNVKNPSKTSKDIYRKTFHNIDEIESTYDLELKNICEQLKNGL
ncbi:MAG: hypothetical protein ICV66_14330 [Chitinophagaceae bacterium]|nr:hypothetical protein [Chitinophagaceae bacterium]